MEAASEGENNKNNSDSSPIEGPKKPKRQMKTPYQLEILEKTYASETYPSEATRAELSVKLGLSDRQLQMWFCHRRLKDKKDGGVKKPPASGAVVAKRGLLDSDRDELMVAERDSDHGSRSRSGSGSGSDSGSDSSQFDYGGGVPMVGRYYESPPSVMERRVVACVEAQLGEPLREDGPILGVDFDELPPGAFGVPIVMTKQRDQSGVSYGGKSFEQCDLKPIKAAVRGHRECLLDEPNIGFDSYGRLIPSNFYDSPVECPRANPSVLVHGNGRLSRGYGVQGQVQSVSLSSQQGRQGHFSSPSGDNNCIAQRESLINMQLDASDGAHPAIVPENTDASDRHISNSEYGLQMEKKRKSDESRIGRQVDANEKRIRKELEKQDILRRKREEQMKREMEKQDRERRKEEERLMREKQRLQERFEREERREIERREKFLQKESLRAERKRQKEELRREKEEVRLKASLERATARRMAKESMELIEDERLELMELAASSKGLPSIISLDHDTLQNLESFRDLLCSFPPKSVQLKRPFAIQPWTDSEENIGNLLMVWRFCITFADVLGLWPFTLDEFVQAFHDYDSRLLSEIHISLLKLIIKDIEDVARTPSTGLGTNQCSSANPEGGHPQIVEGAYLWGFDICTWKNHLNPLTWPEILRQFALSAGFGPQLKKKGIDRACLHDKDETKGCEDIISVLRNGSAAENAVAIMQEKGFPLQRRSRHRLTPGTVKFAAYHVLSLEGNKGLTVLELAHKIQKSRLRDLTTSKTPEASISVALSRDAVLFERTAPSTYCVRPAFRKDPADAEALLAAAREKIKRFENGFLSGENADDVERDEDSEGEGADGPEVHDLGSPNANKNSSNEDSTNSGNEKDNFLDDVTLNMQNEPDTAGTSVNQFIDDSGKDNVAIIPDQGDTEIDESKSGEPWVQGLTEGEYSDLSVEERLNALVALVGKANEGNSIRAVLEDRLDAANVLKKQMWAEAQLDKKRIKEESIPKFLYSSFTGNETEIKQTCAATESSQSPLAGFDDKISESPPNTVKKESFVGADNVQDHLNSLPPDRILVGPDNSICQISSSVQQNGYAAERSRLQLKTYIGHRAEEMYIYRSLPLGQDRRRNRYWRFVASASRHDPGSGRIFVESPDGYWRLIDSEEAFDALLASLDTRGIRESHLHIMLRNIEKSFKENVRKNSQSASIMGRSVNVGNKAAEMDSSPAQSGGADSPSSTVSGSNSSTGEPSFSFRIELGKNETEKKAAMERYQEFQMWMWKECFNSSTLCAMRYGEKRCRPLLGICDFCLDSYIVENDHCPSCYRSFGTFDNKINLSEHVPLCEEERKESRKNSNISKFHPLRIRLLRTLLTVIEVSVPSEALQSSWMENCRKTWVLSYMLHCLLWIFYRVCISLYRSLQSLFQTRNPRISQTAIMNHYHISEAIGRGKFSTAIMNHYHISEAIGRGKFSTVYKGRKKKTTEYFAIKSVDKSQKSKVLQEVKILHSLDHPNVLKFYSWYETSAHLWLVLEYCVGGDLMSLLQQDKKLPEESIHDFAHDLVKALQFLHSKGIIYCDLKPSNILLDENGRTKLCDFGLSRKLSDISKTPSSLLPQAKRGTPFYMAPELFQDGGVHSYASDLWALGCVLYECYAGNPPFIGKEFTRLVKSILSDPTPSLPGTPSRPFVNLINSLLIKDPAERIQWTELCEHAFWRTKFTPLPLPPQPAFTDMIELLSKPYLSERNSDNPPQNKTPPKYREKDSKGGPKQDENCIVGSRGYVTPVKGVSSGRKIQMKASGKVVEEKQKDPSSNTRDVNLLRLSRMAKSNLQRENEKENYRRPLPNGSENDAEVKIENTDMELDFDENTEDETNDDPDGSDNPTCPEEKMSTQNQHEGKLEQMDNNNNTNQLDASPMINTPVSDDTRAPDLDLSSEHNEMGPTPPTVSPQLKRVKEGSEYALDSDTSKSSNDLTQVLWHPSDLSVRPVMPSRKADKMSIPSLPIDALPATDYVKMPKDQVDTFNNRIITILKGNTAIGEKQNVIRYLEMLSSNADAANILTNGSIMLVVVKMLRQSKASALRVQLASLIGLLIRHSTFIDDELANSGILGSLTDGLRDKQEKVRRFSMAALGELLFYISTQNEHIKDNNPPESPPSKDSRFSSGWQVSNPLISLVSSILRKGEDDVTQLYALRTIENICSQGGYWAARFTSQDVITNLCYIFRAAGKQESMRLTAGSCLVRLVRFNPPSIQQVMDKLPFRDTVSGFVKGSPREQQICLNLLNMAMIGSHMFTNIGRHLPLVEGKNLVPCLVALIEQGSEVLRGKALVFVALLCKHGKRWLPHFFCNAKLLSAVDRLAKEKDSYIQQCLDAFVHVVASTIPGLLEAITGDIQQMMGGRRPGHIAALNSRATPKTNFHLFPVIYQILVSSSFKRRVVTNQVLQQLANLIKLAESPFQGRDDFQITLLRVLESITEEPSVILESPNIFIREILPSLAVVYKGNKDWDARFLCLKIMFDVMVIFLNEPTEDEEQSLALKSISNTHFLPLYPTLIEDEDPIPMYAQKLLVMLIEFNYIKIPDILHLKIISQCFEFLLGDLSTANVNNVMLCLALASAPELESKILSQLKVVRRIGNLLELVYAKEMEDFIEPTLGFCRAFLLRSINNRKGFIYARINRKGFIYARIEVIVSELKSSSTPGVSDAAFSVALELQRLPRCI